VTPPPLAIVQARIASTRLPAKMLLDLGGKPLVRWATDAAIEAFGRENVVAAIPASAENDELARVLSEVCEVFRWDGPENDVLGRFYYCAHRYRWHPDSVIVRVTPDDPFKVPAMMRRVANGERWPVEQGGEAFTLATLTMWRQRAFVGFDMGEPTWYGYEHLSHLIGDAPHAPPGIWTVDTAEDLEAARKWLRKDVVRDTEPFDADTLVTWV
jgi:spore coat polysaccharide biosynthesis protein SpsF (cytidylyltransferase family)